MATITTPTTAVRARELSKAQRDAIRLGYGINDYPYQADRTYLIFDAVVGTNTIKLATGASSNYFISKGNFQGFDIDNDEPIIEVYIGSNHPSNLLVKSFFENLTLEKCIIPFSTTMDGEVFQNASKLKCVDISGITNIGASAFFSCDNLQEIKTGTLTTVGANAFSNCVKLKSPNVKNVSTFGGSCFNGCKFHTLEINYNPGLTVDTNAFQGVELSDIIVNNADGTQALEVQNKITAGGATLMNGYRLLY
jgi:hypothetical protein